MQTVLSRNDMLATRNLLRWISLGTQPSKQNTAAVSELIKPLDPAIVPVLRRVMDEAGRGVLASQEVCKEAQEQLQSAFAGLQDDHVERGEVDRG